MLDTFSPAIAVPASFFIPSSMFMNCIGNIILVLWPLPSSFSASRYKYMMLKSSSFSAASPMASMATFLASALNLCACNCWAAISFCCIAMAISVGGVMPLTCTMFMSTPHFQVACLTWSFSMLFKLSIFANNSLMFMLAIALRVSLTMTF